MVEYKPVALEDLFLAIEKLRTDVTDPRVIVDGQKIIVVPGDEGRYAYCGSLQQAAWKNWTIHPPDWVEKALQNIGIIQKVAWQHDASLGAVDWLRTRWMKDHNRSEYSILDCPIDVRCKFAIYWFS